MSSSKYRHAGNRLHIAFPFFLLFQSNLGVGGGGECIALTWCEPYIYICQRYICFLLSKINNQSHLISNLSHMLCRYHHKYKRILKTHKYIHYKSNVLSTFSWLVPVLTPALDIRMAKSGSNLVHSHPSHILCLTPSKKIFSQSYPVLWWCTIKLILIAKVSEFLKI